MFCFTGATKTINLAKITKKKCSEIKDGWMYTMLWRVLYLVLWSLWGYICCKTQMCRLLKVWSIVGHLCQGHVWTPCHCYYNPSERPEPLSYRGFQLRLVGCSLTSHSAIFQLYSDGTVVQFPNFDLLPGTQCHGQLGVFSVPSLPQHGHQDVQRCL